MILDYDPVRGSSPKLRHPEHPININQGFGFLHLWGGLSLSPTPTRRFHFPPRKQGHMLTREVIPACHWWHGLVHKGCLPHCFCKQLGNPETTNPSLQLRGTSASFQSLVWSGGLNVPLEGGYEAASNCFGLKVWKCSEAGLPCAL